MAGLDEVVMRAMSPESFMVLGFDMDAGDALLSDGNQMPVVRLELALLPNDDEAPVAHLEVLFPLDAAQQLVRTMTQLLPQ